MKKICLNLKEFIMSHFNYSSQNFHQHEFVLCYIVNTSNFFILGCTIPRWYNIFKPLKIKASCHGTNIRVDIFLRISLLPKHQVVYFIVIGGVMQIIASMESLSTTILLMVSVNRGVHTSCSK